MELWKAEALAWEKMQLHGLPGKGWTFDFFNSNRAFGVCRYLTKEINLSIQLTLLNDESEVLDTILHEIAHALCSYKEHHGPIWKETAAKIGARPERCYSESTTVTVVPKYIGTCPNRHTVHRHKKPRGERSCAECSTHFDRNYLITFKLNDE